MFDATNEAFAASVLEGLAQTPKLLEPKWFYDAAGSALFDQICNLPEYYPTRTEAKILHDASVEIAQALGPGVVLYEPGAGSAEKARTLLDVLNRPAAFAPADICLEHVEQASELHPTTTRSPRTSLTIPVSIIMHLRAGMSYTSDSGCFAVAVNINDHALELNIVPGIL